MNLKNFWHLNIFQMHSKKDGEKNPAILPHDPRFFHIMGGNTENFSFLDIYKINERHGCIGK